MIFRQIIIDNILDDPEEALEVARAMKWGPFGDGYYQGRTSMETHAFDEVEGVINSLFPNFGHLPYSSRFRLARKGEEQANTIHCDFGCSVSGILYLTKEAKDVYTSFYKDQRGFDNYTEFKRANPEMTDELLFEEFKNNSLWKETYRIEGKFNRLVLFDSSLWHGPSLGFGDDFDSARLVQVFFLKRME